jgi:hypothetical protein
MIPGAVFISVNEADQADIQIRFEDIMSSIPVSTIHCIEEKHRMLRRSVTAINILAIMVLLFQGSTSQARQAATPDNIEGTFSIVWGDSEYASTGPFTNYYLTSGPGRTVQLLISEEVLSSAGGALALDRQMVSVSGAWQTDGNSMPVQTIIPTSGSTWSPEGIYGPQPWVSILCKFNDVPAEPNNLNFFNQMYSAQYPGLDHFWRQNSYDLANLQGSGAFGWFVLPHPRAYYFNGSGNLIHERAALDCTQVADSTVNFNNYVGINMMFNDNLDCCAWGGAWYLCLDGTCQVWRMTWEPPWGYQNIGVIAHETGHGFGLPHSLGNCLAGYDNRWDVLSDVWSNGTDPSFPQFGTQGQHTIAYHKEMLEWITPDQQYTARVNTGKTITLERLALPQSDNYLEARILINNSTQHYYTLEVRQPIAQQINYDKWLPGFAVIIHDIDLTRGDPAVVIDPDGDCNTGDAGAMWTTGEVFRDANNGISVTIGQSTGSGYIVTINNQFTPMESVAISAEDSGWVEESILFTAAASPSNATTPITYTWEATGLSPVVHVGGTFDQLDFSWDSVGTKLITVTAENNGSSVMDTHTILIDSLIPIVSVTGPEDVIVGKDITFMATSVPTDVVLPITYTWQVDGEALIVKTGGYTDTLELAWDTPGPKQVKVTAENAHGSTSDEMPVMVRIPPESLVISGQGRGFVNQDYTFMAAVLPITATVPFTYTWWLDGIATITEVDGSVNEQTFTWNEPGLHTISVTASSPAGAVMDEWTITVYMEIYLPLALRQ